jgi:RHS repeat-associated protein
MDGHSGVRILTDKLGNLTDTSSYDAYGNAIDPLSAEFGYRGESFEDLTRLQYLRARYYEPSTGLFLGVDPFEGDVNSPVSRHRYLYGNANPVSYADPSGMFPTLGELMESIQIQTLLLTYVSLNINIVQLLYGKYLSSQNGNIEWKGDYYSAGITSGGIAVLSGAKISLMPGFDSGIGGGLMVLETDGIVGEKTHTKGNWLILGGLITYGLLPISASKSSTIILSPATKNGTDTSNLSGGFMTLGASIGAGWFSAGWSATMMGLGVGKIATNLDSLKSPFNIGFDASFTGFTGLSIPFPKF